MNIVFVGAGRLATQFANSLHDAGHSVLAVFSRTLTHASELCARVGGIPTDTVAHLPLGADAYIVAVTDAALPALVSQLIEHGVRCPVFHTAGSMPIAVLHGFPHHGVIYPMQTFSKERVVDFSHLPVFIETNDDISADVAHCLAASVSNQVHSLDSDSRRYLHLAAVFACNFSNHCYSLAAAILERYGIGFEVMLPLIEETAQKVRTMAPRQAQTGPAVRYDENVIAAQHRLLEDAPMMQQVYDVMSRSIHHITMSDTIHHD